jgi:DNA-binding SARP family transcriptional activator
MAEMRENGRAPARSRMSSLLDPEARGPSQGFARSKPLASPATARHRQPAALEYRVLGPFEVLREGAGIVPIAAAKERALLLVLLLRANEIVPAERLIDGIWGEHPPRCGANVLQNCISHLRKRLEPGACASASEVLLTRQPGYLLRVDCQQLDSARLESSLERSGRAAKRGALHQAARLLREGEGLWRGPALADFSLEEFARSEIARLEELRLLTMAERVEVELALGRHAFLVSELTRLVDEHPLNERFRNQLMLALYRSGRQAEALAVYRAGRETLVEQVGIDPCPALQALEGAILRQEPFLDQLDWRRWRASSASARFVVGSAR